MTNNDNGVKMPAPTLNFDWVSHQAREAVLGHDLDFYKLFGLIAEKHDTVYYFESLSLPRHQDRYYTLGFDPAALFIAKGNTLTVKGNPETLEKLTKQKKTEVVYNNVNPYKLLQNSFPEGFLSTTHQGGLIGYFCHEAVNYFEPSLSLREHPDFDTFKLGLYLDGLIFDTLTSTLKYYTYAEDRSAQIKELINQIPTYETPDHLESVEFIGHSATKEEFIGAVQRTQQKIKEGFSFQSEVGFKSNFKIRGNKRAIYNRLRNINPSPYMYYLKFGDEELMGASPEILVSCKQGRALTTPTAGTTKRGKDHREDTILARTLLNDPKEIAEHNMLVDLHRNDLAHVSRPGSVRVEDLMYIIKFSHVQHIVSLITSELAKDKSAFNLLASIFPGGVVTGAPKIETIKIIAENENAPRGPYGGAVGRFAFSGDCDFCLPIRSIFCKGDDCFAQTSAGIVYDSVPEKEYDELTNKLAAMKQTLSELGGDFESR
jgi:anthranilate synthase component 1